MNTSKLSLEKLEIVISELRKNGEESIDLEKLLEDLYSKYNAERLTIQSYVEIKKRVGEKLKKSSQIATENGFSKKILSSLPETFVKIVTHKKTNRKGKILELKELEIAVDEKLKDLEQIDLVIKQIKPKIININSIYNSNRNNLDIYQSSELKELRTKIHQILDTENSNTKLILSELTNFKENLDQVISILNNLLELSKYRTKNTETYSVIEYNIHGVIIKINIKEKLYEIEFNNNLKDILAEAKINKLKQLLEIKLENISLNEIIEPASVNETKLSEFITKKELPLEDILKFDINGLMSYLQIDNEINKLNTFEEISKYSEKLYSIYQLVTVLNRNGFNKEFRTALTLDEELERDYQKIDLNAQGFTTKEIGKVIYNKYPNGDYVYSSLQSAYNCLNPTIRKNLHQELENEVLQQSEIIKQVIEFIRKYSRNKEGNYYPDDEILNFLLQKHTVIKTATKGSKIPEIEEYKQLRNKVYGATENEVLNKLSRKPH